MVQFIRHLVWLLRGVQVFALVGRSGTGKSFRAKLVAEKYGIELIIDDGLLIRDQKIIAGRSAKREKLFLSAIKTALFEDPAHLREVREAIDREKFRRILLIGTSERMVRKIAGRLGLPTPSKVLSIEQLASKEEIETAIKSRTEGKHVIPVPSIEIRQNYPQFVYDSVKVFFKKKLGLLPGGQRAFEKTVVQPEFSSKRGKVEISEAALTQMVLHCVDEWDDAVSVRKVSVKHDAGGYHLHLKVHLPIGVNLSGSLHDMQEYIISSLQRYGGVLITSVDITVDAVQSH
ncbi:ATP-binding cassette domain-containing protein [Sediminispirochaeta smaragdinae]|jgi:adenylate kinase family enzyme|uniref:Uncharacterized protein n=1 Tax=Sediminispirochaeta smaragdinae (strain DSM 11293 / JCM 15392 / SEBR 4228) TaxID=573413 RepID=E1R6L5_SEDSS|nr:hypothetical protein [Sediminispirochaeta smaragdinae]ADK81033.1 conserved hypothetical protein [Sediminispirochaeta smaragdinae DSM 11293]